MRALVDGSLTVVGVFFAYLVVELVRMAYWALRWPHDDSRHAGWADRGR